MINISPRFHERTRRFKVGELAVIAFRFPADFLWCPSGGPHNFKIGTVVEIMKLPPPPSPFDYYVRAIFDELPSIDPLSKEDISTKEWWVLDAELQCYTGSTKLENN